MLTVLFAVLRLADCCLCADSTIPAHSSNVAEPAGGGFKVVYWLLLVNLNNAPGTELHSTIDYSFVWDIML